MVFRRLAPEFIGIDYVVRRTVEVRAWRKEKSAATTYPYPEVRPLRVQVRQPISAWDEVPTAPKSAYYRRRCTANRRSVGASDIAASSDHAAHRTARCSRHSGWPSVATGRNAIRNPDPGSWSSASAVDTAVTRSPNSSCSSRLSASASDSPHSTFPPGNSHMPPYRFSSER